MNSVCFARPLFSLALLASFLLTACGSDSDSGRPDGQPGVMRIVTVPGGADVHINGDHHGVSPGRADEALSVRLPAGEYTLEALRTLDGLTEYHGTQQVRHVEDQVTPVITMRLERRDTEAGKQRLEAFKEAALARFVINDDGTVTDIDKGLVWMRCSVGQSWTGRGCDGDARLLNWDRAKKVVDEFNREGKGDWRLPTQPELYSLTYCSTGRRTDFNIDGLGGGCVGDFQVPTILLSVFPDTPAGNFWSSTPHANLSYSAWGVAFRTGYTGVGGRSDFTHVRLVRDLE